MTEEENKTPENVEEEPVAQTGEVTTRDKLGQVLNAMQALPVRCVNIVYIPETGELLLNHSVGMPRHEIVGLMEAVRDETKK
jgi:hypothetical protein